jgi:tRNA U34 5-methylaminomethyl-2-thiouridine-forming methyltransferase MnmC
MLPSYFRSMLFTPDSTADGSFTFFSTDYGEAFHSQHGARQEAICKFVEPTNLIEKATRPKLRLLDICYGLGYNTAAALEAIWRVNPNCQVDVIGLEIDETVAQAAISHHLLDSWHPKIQQVLAELAQTFHVQTPHFKAQLSLGDARHTLQQLDQEPFDAVFLDPFSPPHCPQLWTVEFLTLVARHLKLDGRLTTYSCSAAVRTALIAAGFKIGSTNPVGRRSTGTVACKQTAYSIDLPALSPRQQEHLLTRAAIPYRDRTLSDSAETILQRRQEEWKISSLEPTSHWKKRWLMPI